MSKKQEELKQEIFEKIKEYYEITHKQQSNKPFIKGKSRVAYAGRVLMSRR